jgi:hypothetical protein
MSMAVLVKGMEMPENCWDCSLLNAKSCPCKNYASALEYTTARHPGCPLVEVPEPHGRLGDLDKLEQMFVDIDNAPYSGFDGEEPFYSAEDAAQIIRLAPTAFQARGEV